MGYAHSGVEHQDRRVTLTCIWAASRQVAHVHCIAVRRARRSRKRLTVLRCIVPNGHGSQSADREDQHICAALRHVRQAAELFAQADRWLLLVPYIGGKLAPTLRPFNPQMHCRPPGDCRTSRLMRLDPQHCADSAHVLCRSWDPCMVSLPRPATTCRAWNTYFIGPRSPSKAVSLNRLQPQYAVAAAMPVH